MSVKKFICPRCQEEWTGFPALGRIDNKTEICSPCGIEEGMQDYFGVELTPYNL